MKHPKNDTAGRSAAHAHRSDKGRRRVDFRRPAFLLVVVLALALVAASTALADATPTPERPHQIYLPVIVKNVTPPQPVTISFQQGNADYGGTTTTYISSYGDPYAPHGFEPVMAVRWERSQIADAEAGLVSFDLTSIPDSSLVLEATLRVFPTSRSNLNGMTLSAYGVLRPWEATQANWYSATQVTAWATRGCNGINSDRLGLATAIADVPDINMWVDLPVAALVQDWVRHPERNFGVVLKPTGQSTTPAVRYELASALFPEQEVRPILTLRYIVVPPPIPTVVPPSATPTRSPTPTSNIPTATATGTSTPTPTWTPSASWWNINYTHRRRLTVHTTTDYGVGAGYAVSLTLNTGDLIAAGKLRPDLNDWRVVAWNGYTWLEINRDVAAPAETWFSLLRPIAAGSSDDLYYVYYGNPVAVSPAPSDKSQVYAFYDDFTTYDAGKWPWPPPSGVEVGGGVVTVTAYNASGDPADSCPGAYDCMLSRQSFGVGYQVQERTQHPDYVYTKKLDADQGFSDDGHSNEAKLRSYNTGQFQRVNRDGVASVVSQCCAAADTNWHIFTLTRLDLYNILFQIDSSPVETSTTRIPLMALPVHIRAYSEEPMVAARNVVDWIKVRPVVASEPFVAWGAEEKAIFGLRIW